MRLRGRRLDARLRVVWRKAVRVFLVAFAVWIVLRALVGYVFGE